MLILDTSAILSGKFFSGAMATTPKVIDEFKPGGHSWRLLQYLRESGLKTMQPPSYAIEEVKKAAEKTGDIASLSPADIEVLALAFHLKDSILLTDDYAMQNVAKELEIKWKGILEEGIKEKIYWMHRCASCGRFFKKKYETCPFCGGKVKKVRKKE
ncbi:MAG: NOB1 family endonuclease [Thermoplasmata archaeon]|nr:NOB1 family endonuclease [Thermoplasmata archaeon]